METPILIMVVIQVAFWLFIVSSLAYLVVRRIRLKREEKFEKRSN